MLSVLFSKRSVWWGVFCAALLPFASIVYLILVNQLGADPVKEVVELLGLTAWYVLILVLAITPLKDVLGVRFFSRYRRMLGLYALFYALLHAGLYLTLIVNWSELGLELTKRPYVLLGALALAILIVLGVTSLRSIVRWLGKRWKPLHRLVYLAAVLVVAHVVWQVRVDYAESIMYGVVLVVLLLLRLAWFRRLIKFTKTSNK